jgi:hypothetical protein
VQIHDAPPHFSADRCGAAMLPRDQCAVYVQ